MTRLAWAKERRVCQIVRLARERGTTLLLANLHASKGEDERVADAELLRVADFLVGSARTGEAIVLAGDLNVTAERSWNLPELTRPAWGFSAAAPGIDHVLVRGAPAGPPAVWPDERRRADGRLLSDHAPVEVLVG